MQRRRLHIEGYRDRRPPRLPRAATTHSGFRRWITSLRFPQEVRPTFVDGEIWLSMSPESLETHNKVKTEFTAVFARHVQERDLGEVYSDRSLLTNVDARVSTEPDLLFVSWAASETGRVTLGRRKRAQEEFIEIVGTPDVVLEIVSDSSVRKDLVRLKEAYERARIPEYWVVDARGDQIRFEILSLASDGYHPSAPANQPQTSRALAARFALRRGRNRLGRFDYRLEMEPLTHLVPLRG
jgi:Uma2 family endonuclease